MIVPDDHDPYETLKRSKYIIQDIKFDDSKLIDSLKNLIPISGSVSPLNVSLFIQSLLGKFYLSEIGNNERKLINYLTDYIYLHNHLIEEAICSLIVLSTASSSSEASWFRTLENSSLSTVGKCFLSALSKRDPYSFFSRTCLAG